MEPLADRPDVVLSERHVRVSAPARLPRLHAGMDAVLRMLAALLAMEVLPVTTALDYRDHRALDLQGQPRRPSIHYPPRLHPGHLAAASAQLTTPPASTVILAALLALSACQTKNATPSALPRTSDVELDAARTDSPVTPAPRSARTPGPVPTTIQATATAVPPYSPAPLPVLVPVVAAGPLAHSVDQVPRRVLAETLALEAFLAAPVHPDPGSLLEWEWPE